MKETREQRRSWENHRQSWGGGQLATQLDVSLRLWQAEKSTRQCRSGFIPHPMPPCCALLSRPRALPTPQTRPTLGRSWGWREWLRRARGCQVAMRHAPCHQRCPRTRTAQHSQRPTWQCIIMWEAVSIEICLAFGLLCAKTIHFFELG